jgi:hypothetical protein
MKHLFILLIMAISAPLGLQAQSCPAPYATTKHAIGTDGFTVSFAAASCE